MVEPRQKVTDYVNLIENVAQAEFRRWPESLVAYDEMVNIAAIALHVLFLSNPEKEYDNLSLAISARWAIRNELKYRHEEYALSDISEDDSYGAELPDQVRETEFVTFLSYELQTGPLAEVSLTADVAAEARTYAKRLRHAISALPKDERQILEARLCKGLKRHEIGNSLFVSPLRILRLMKAGMRHIARNAPKTAVPTGLSGSPL